MSDTPTKPGFYWAKWIIDNRWQPVEFSTAACVWVMETDVPYSAESFTWGPEITKPEGLE